MANKGINNAQDNIFSQSDGAVGGRTSDDTFSFGSVHNPLTVPADNQMWWGSGNPTTNNNISDNTSAGVETALKFHIRSGADLTPTSSGPNGEQLYTAPAGTQGGLGTHSTFNFDYGVTSAPGVVDGNTVDLTSQSLAKFDVKMDITASGGNFQTPQSAIFTLNAAGADAASAPAHVWTDQNGTVAFGGDDFTQPGASDALKAAVAENSENLAFIKADFGGNLANMTAAGTNWDIQLAVFDKGTGHLVDYTHNNVTLVATPS